MKRDLSLQSSKSSRESAEVLIVGAGIAGITLAKHLSLKGVRSVMLESGSNDGEQSFPNGLNEVQQVGQFYRGALEGRSRGVGGTSRLWGGALLPFLPCDIEENTAGWSLDWVVDFPELEAYFPDIERDFKLPSGDYSCCATASDSNDAFIQRSAKWPSFSRRNLARAFNPDTDASLIDLWINTTVLGFEFGDNGLISLVRAQSPNGNTLVIAPSIVVICAGAIESTRLLLLMDSAHGNRIFSPDGQLGRYFSDHLSTPVAKIDPIDKNGLNRVFSFKFNAHGMRDLRLEAGPALRRTRHLPGAFAHVTYSSQASGFSALRNIFRNYQRDGKWSVSEVGALHSDLPWLAKAVWWRFFHKTLLYPTNGELSLQLVLEQAPNYQSSISLSSTETDFFGVPRVRLDWQTSDEDFKNFSSLQSEIFQFWQTSFFSSLANLELIPRFIWQPSLESGSDIYHPSGTTRIGKSQRTGVVDKNLFTFRVPNLAVVSTSSFPTGGGANPTFMLMAFALRTADLIAKKIGGSQLA